MRLKALFSLCMEHIVNLIGSVSIICKKFDLHCSVTSVETQHGLEKK